MEIVSCEADLAASQKLIESAICLVSRSLSAYVTSTISSAISHLFCSLQEDLASDLMTYSAPTYTLLVSEVATGATADTYGWNWDWSGLGCWRRTPWTVRVSTLVMTCSTQFKPFWSPVPLSGPLGNWCVHSVLIPWHRARLTFLRSSSRINTIIVCCF